MVFANKILSDTTNKMGMQNKMGMSNKMGTPNKMGTSNKMGTVDFIGPPRGHVSPPVGASCTLDSHSLLHCAHLRSRSANDTLALISSSSLPSFK